MLGHYTTPPVSLSIPIGCPCCQRKHTCLGSKASAREARYLQASAREVHQLHQVHQVRTGTWPRRWPARETPHATCSDRGRGGAGAPVLEPHLAPFAAAGVSGAGPQHAVGDVDDDAPDRAVIEVALRHVMLAH